MMGVGCGFGSIVGVFLLVSGIISAYPKAGAGLIAAGLSGVALSIIAPELQAKATIVAYGVAISLVAIVVSATVYLIWHQWKSLKSAGVVIDRAKTQVIPAALMASPEDIDSVQSIESVASKVMDPGVTKVFNVVRRQLRAEARTQGDRIDGEKVDAPAASSNGAA